MQLSDAAPLRCMQNIKRRILLKPCCSGSRFFFPGGSGTDDFTDRIVLFICFRQRNASTLKKYNFFFKDIKELLITCTLTLVNYINTFKCQL